MAANAQTKPTAARRLFFTRRFVIEVLPDRAQMCPAVSEVEFVDELLTQSQRAQRGSRTVDEYLIIEFIEFIGFGLADPSTVGQHELV